MTIQSGSELQTIAKAKSGIRGAWACLFSGHVAVTQGGLVNVHYNGQQAAWTAAKERMHKALDKMASRQ